MYRGFIVHLHNLILHEGDRWVLSL
jgi:hypothetical protein